MRRGSAIYIAERPLLQPEMREKQASLKPVDVTTSSSRAWDMAGADEYIEVPGL
jgi:hypothetical protein